MITKNQTHINQEKVQTHVDRKNLTHILIIWNQLNKITYFLLVTKPSHKECKTFIFKQIYWTRTYFPTGYTCEAKTDVPNSNPSKKQIPEERQKENIPRLVKLQTCRLQNAKLQLQRAILWPLRHLIRVGRGHEFTDNKRQWQRQCH